MALLTVWKMALYLRESSGGREGEMASHGGRRRTTAPGVRDAAPGSRRRGSLSGLVMPALSLVSGEGEAGAGPTRALVTKPRTGHVSLRAMAGDGFLPQEGPRTFCDDQRKNLPPCPHRWHPLHHSSGGVTKMGPR